MCIRDRFTGVVVEGRPLEHYSTSSGDTENRVTVTLVGDLNFITPTQVAINSVMEIVDEFGGHKNVRGHQERPAATQCPGRHGMDLVRRIRAGEFEQTVESSLAPPPAPIGDGFKLDLSDNAQVLAYAKSMRKKANEIKNEANQIISLVEGRK